MLNKWVYKGKDFTQSDIGDAVCFIYLITNLATGKKYIGKKSFYIGRSKQYSDWMSYTGSSKFLNEDIDKYGAVMFSKEILHLCTSTGEGNYLEAKEQFSRGVLESEDYYNQWINVRVSANHINSYLNNMNRISIRNRMNQMQNI